MAGTATYVFHRCLGRGGFGEVYLATQRATSGLEKRVAVKVLREDLRDESNAVRRLRDEGRMLAMLDHPAILGVLEMTRIRGRIALVTEFVEGTDLSRCCRAGTMLPPRVALSVIAEVASALDTAWTTSSPETGKPLRLIHRDIKPENIRLSRHGEVKLLDFGIARSEEMSREARTAMGDIPFTPGYAAPESFLEGVQDAPTDIFALGATLFRVLVGERFYRGKKLSEQVAISADHRRYRHFVHRRVAMVPEGLHPDLEPLLLGMLAWSPEDRPDAAQVQHRAEAIADEVPGPTPRRWARLTTFASPDHTVDGAAWTGLELDEDDVSQVIDPRAARLPDEVSTESGGMGALLRPPQVPAPPPGLDSMKPVTVEAPVDGFRSEEGEIETRMRRTPDPGPEHLSGPSSAMLFAQAGVALVVAGLVLIVMGAAALTLSMWMSS